MFLALINHSLWQHCFNHLVHIVSWLEQIISKDAIVVYLISCCRLFVSNAPVEAYITGPLMSQLKRTFGLFVAYPPEDEESLLCLTQVGRLLFYIGASDVDLSGSIDVYKMKKFKEMKLKITYHSFCFGQA